MSETKVSDPIKPGDIGFVNPGAPNLIRLYANSFTLGPTLSDMYMIGSLNNSPSFVVNMSFNTAKTLKQALDNLIADFEKTTSMEIKGVHEIQESYVKAGQIPSTPK